MALQKRCSILVWTKSSLNSTLPPAHQLSNMRQNEQLHKQELAISEDQFLDIGIPLGFDQSPPFPPSVHEWALKATVDMVKYYKSGHSAVSAFSEHLAVKAMQYNDHFARSRTMIKCSLVLNFEGAVQPLPLAITSSTSSTSGSRGHHNHLTAADIPVDRLPDEVYFYLFWGLMGPQALIWLTTGQIIENPPLDNGETSEYIVTVIITNLLGPSTEIIVHIDPELPAYLSLKGSTRAMGPISSSKGTSKTLDLVGSERVISSPHLRFSLRNQTDRRRLFWNRYGGNNNLCERDMLCKFWEGWDMNDLAKELWAGERIRCMVIVKQSSIDLMIVPARETSTAQSVSRKSSALLVKNDECVPRQMSILHPVLCEQTH